MIHFCCPIVFLFFISSHLYFELIFIFDRYPFPCYFPLLSFNPLLYIILRYVSTFFILLFIYSVVSSSYGEIHFPYYLSSAYFCPYFILTNIMVFLLSIFIVPSALLLLVSFFRVILCHIY